MSDNDIDNQEIVLSERGMYIAIEGLSGEEEDNLYMHLERVHGEEKVVGAMEPYRVKVDGVSRLELLRQIAEFCVQNGKRVNV